MLEIFSETGPEFGHGFSNHGPMAAEAMIALNRSDKAKPWAELYHKRLHPHPQPRDRIAEENWREALGAHHRIGDWVVFFREQLNQSSWQDVIGRFVPELAPGMMAGGTHGVIRTGHAVRSLTKEETALRLNELAKGLAYWAALFMRLPGRRLSPTGRLKPSQAIEEVPVVPRELLEKYGLIQDSMAALLKVDNFADTINRIDVSGDSQSFISELTEITAACYLSNATDIMHAITFIHGVTAPSILRIIIPYVPAQQLDAVLSYAWQTVVALYSVAGQQGKPVRCDNFELDADDLVEKAIDTGDEHAVKFTEACLREYGLNPKPVYLAASLHASRLIGKEPVSPPLARC